MKNFFFFISFTPRSDEMSLQLFPFDDLHDNQIEMKYC